MVRLGNEVFLDSPSSYLGGRRVGLVINHTSFTSRMRSLLAACLSRDDIRVTAVFGPEHGFDGRGQDMQEIPDLALPDGTPVYSLYGDDVSSLKPSREALSQVDALVFDIQDVGVRYYTFIWTLSLCMEACAEAGREMIVLDRPNPLGGRVVSGPVQEEGFLSFVGRFPIPVRHGMTVGELARLFKGAFSIDCALRVVPMEGWNRDMWFDQTGLPWIPPSPNMVSLDTAIVYPGACLLEGTTLSEGRGTTTPFQVFGAPGIDAEELARKMNRAGHAGCLFRPVAFVPAFHKYAGEVCAGLFVHVTDRESFDAFDVYSGLIGEVAASFPQVFSWRSGVYEFVTDIPAIDLLTGSDRFRRDVTEGRPYCNIFHGEEAGTREFLETRREYLLYV